MTDTQAEPTPDARPSRASVPSYSSLTTHRTCPQKWNYAYLQRLETDAFGDTIDRDLGSWWHAFRAMDAIVVGHDRGSLRYVPDQITTGDSGPTLTLVGTYDPAGELPRWVVKTRTGPRVLPTGQATVAALAAAWWRTLGTEEGGDAEQWAERTGEALPDALRRMDLRWRERWASENDHEDPVAVELRWRRALGDSWLQGTADLVYLDRSRDMLVVRDLKTRRNLGPTALDDMMDSQPHLYSWGLAEMFDEPIRAVSYDRARSTAPKLPKVTIQGNLAKTPSDYDLATYLAWSTGPDGEGVPWGEEGAVFASGKRKGEPKFGRYLPEESVLDHLRTPDELGRWFDRSLTPINPRIVSAHLASSAHTIDDIGRTRGMIADTGAAPRNFTRYGCTNCDFQQLCRAQMIGGPDGDYPPEDYGLRPKN